MRQHRKLLEQQGAVSFVDKLLPPGSAADKKDTAPLLFIRHNNVRGFTLVELIIVILIIGILAVAFGSRFVGKSAYADRRAVDEVVEALRYAQHLAMSRGGGIRVVTTSTTYTVEQTDSTAIRNPNGSGDYSVTLPSGVNISATSITYNSLGQPTPTTDSTINVGSFTITIEGETGYAHY